MRWATSDTCVTSSQHWLGVEKKQIIAEPSCLLTSRRNFEPDCRSAFWYLYRANPVALHAGSMPAFSKMFAFLRWIDIVMVLLWLRWINIVMVLLRLLWLRWMVTRFKWINIVMVLWELRVAPSQYQPTWVISTITFRSFISEVQFWPQLPPPRPFEETRSNQMQ